MSSKKPNEEVESDSAAIDDNNCSPDLDQHDKGRQMSIHIEDLDDNNLHNHSIEQNLIQKGDGNINNKDALRVEPDEDAEFFERFSSIKLTYESTERKNIEDFKFQADPDAIDGEVSNQLWPTIGGWNVDDLYGEVLFSIVNTLRNSNTLESEPLISHLQQAFRIDNDKHEKLLKATKERKTPPLVLNLEVVEAKGLRGKDVNGLSDPFCTLYLNPKQKHNTSMKPETLTPSWREYFSFPVTNTQDEVLNIEVWDYDPEETVTDKMKRFGEVKSTKGLRVLMKEIALTASTGKQQHDFMGCLKVPLKKIPPDGYDTWFSLEGKNGGGIKKSKGEILLRMALGTQKDKKVAAQEYRHVLHLLLVHELDEENILPHQWSGQFINKHSDYILRQLQLQGGLTQIDLNLSKWMVYSRVHCDHPLNAKLFSNLFESVSSYLESLSPDNDEVRKFWFVTEKLMENFIGYVKNVHQCFLANSNIAAQIYHVLKTLSLIQACLSNQKPIIGDSGNKIVPEYITSKVNEAVKRGATEFFTGISQLDTGSTESSIEKMIKIGQLLIADLRKGLEIVQPCFVELLGIQYFDITYRIYDEKYRDILQPVIESVCSNLKRLDIRDDDGYPEDQDLSMGTSLFEVYLAVRQFSDLSSNLQTSDDLLIRDTFHNWFYSSVAQWLDIAFYKAMNRIRKAVQLDNLNPVDDYVQRSSSAVDTAHTFHQIQVFWNQLAWPEVEGSYTFVAKILDDLCRCIICYGEIMCRKVEGMESKTGGSKYQISDELCSAVNNIEYVGQGMRPLSENLGITEIIEELSRLKGELTGLQCKRTLETVMENAIENINNKIYEILEKVGKKMEPVIYRLLLEGAETSNQEEGVETLMKYLDNNLIKIRNRTTPTGFDKLFLIIWENAAVALRQLVRTQIDKKRPPEFYQRIYNMLVILLDFFYPDKQTADDVKENNECIREILEIVELYGASTPDLIMKYQQCRYEYQNSLPLKPGELGMITIRTHYWEDKEILQVEILNARNLKACDANGLCDPYVKIHLVPVESYCIAPQKTKVKKKTLFPLFDELFSFSIGKQGMSEGGLIQFSLKDHDLFGRNDFLGEAYFPLVAVPHTSSDTRLQNLPQRNLVLTRPTLFTTTLFQTLESRVLDKSALDFVKKEKVKSNTLNNNSNTTMQS